MSHLVLPVIFKKACCDGQGVAKGEKLSDMSPTHSHIAGKWQSLQEVWLQNWDSKLSAVFSLSSHGWVLVASFPLMPEVFRVIVFIACACVHLCVHACVCAGQKSASVPSWIARCIVFGDRVSLSLELTDWLATKPGVVFLSPPPQPRGYRYGLPRLASFTCSKDLNLGLCLCGKHFTN